jgi:prefoldin subunit 5
MAGWEVWGTGREVPHESIDKPLDKITSSVNEVREQIKTVRNLQDAGRNRVL